MLSKANVLPVSQGDTGCFEDMKIHPRNDVVPSQLQSTVTFIMQEAEQFDSWQQSLTKWVLHSEDKFYKLWVTRGSKNSLVTLKMEMNISKEGDLLGAYQYLLTTGCGEKGDQNLDLEHIWSSKDGTLRVNRKITKLPFPLWNRAFLQAIKTFRTDNDFILTSVTCAHLFKHKLPPKTLNAFMKGRHHVMRTGDQKYIYNWIAQIDPKGYIPSLCVSWVAGLLRNAICNAYYSVMNANLLEPSLNEFKQNLKDHGVSYYKKLKQKSKNNMIEEKKI